MCALWGGGKGYDWLSWDPFRLVWWAMEVEEWTHGDDSLIEKLSLVFSTMDLKGSVPSNGTNPE